MMNRLLLTITLIFLANVAQAKVFELDTDHSSVGFKIRHLLSSVRGQFNVFAGKVETDEIGALTKLEGSVTAASINTNNKKRDDHLRSEDFFDVKKFRELKFSSEKFKIKAGASGKVPGQLTIHGVTKPVEFEVDYAGELTDPWGAVRMGATGRVKINRKDFGLTWNKALETGGVLVGDDVEIEVEVEAKEVKAVEPKKIAAPVKTGKRK